MEDIVVVWLFGAGLFGLLAVLASPYALFVVAGTFVAILAALVSAPVWLQIHLCTIVWFGLVVAVQASRYAFLFVAGTFVVILAAMLSAPVWLQILLCAILWFGLGAIVWFVPSERDRDADKGCLSDNKSRHP